MPTTENPTAKRESVNIRVRPEDRRLIDRAARIRGKNRTELILDATRRAAEETVLEQTLLRVDPASYAAFLARLDAPAQPNSRLRNTMKAAPPWETP